jgi:hypothetical protein
VVDVLEKSIVEEPVKMITKFSLWIDGIRDMTI